MLKELNLIVFCGLPGVGKTYLAKELQQLSGAVRISRDEIREKLFRNPQYTYTEKKACFDEMLHQAEEALLSGKSVILDGMPFSRRAERDAARRIASYTGAKFFLYHVVCDEALALQRIASDAEHPAADRDALLYHSVKSRFETPSDDENPIILSTDSEDQQTSAESS